MDWVHQWRHWLSPANGFEAGHIGQLLVVALLLLLCSRMAGAARGKGGQAGGEPTNPRDWLRTNRSYLFFWFFILAVHLAGLLADLVFPGIDLVVFRFFVYLGALWILIGLLSSLLRDRFWANSVSAFGYLVTGLPGLPIIPEVVRFLRELRFSAGAVPVSAWDLLAGIFAFILALWITLGLARLIEQRIQAFPHLTPSLKVLVAKIVRIAFLVLTAVIAFSSMGLDLSALAIFGGALGLGLGFGLQKVISNFVSGILLLLDNSIKPGDVIEIPFPRRDLHFRRGTMDTQAPRRSPGPE